MEYPKKLLQSDTSSSIRKFNGLGLKRGKFGDILIIDDRVQFFCAKEIVNMLGWNYNQWEGICNSDRETFIRRISIQGNMDRANL